MAPLHSTSNISVSFSGDTWNSTSLITHPETLITDPIYNSRYLRLEVDDRTTGIALKELIAQKTGVPQDHISLNLNTGSYRSSSLRMPDGHSFLFGTKRGLRDDELVQPALEKPQESLSSPNCVGPSISFSINKCSDPSHCPTVLKVSGLTGILASFSFNKATTAGDLKEKIAGQLQTPIERQRLIFNGEPLSDESILSNLGVGDGSVITLVRTTPPQPQAVEAEAFNGAE